MYNKIGKIRTSSKDGIPIVVSVYFTFDKNDYEFYEEISVKNESIKSEIATFFYDFTYEELKKIGESKLKDILLQKINEKLVLNKIQELYFENLVFFD
jgi:flagellar basal body-associated protein FliL